VEQARAQRAVPPWRPLVLLGSAGPFPFRPRPSVILVPGMPPGVIACMPLLEEWGIASRLASTLDLPGCFEGAVRTLADVWLASLNGEELAQVEVFGNDELARRYGVPSL
jgi:dihydroorotate dehydrogenase electron transfer subunit